MRATKAALAAFPEEGKILGRILLGFGEIEYLISCCVGCTLQHRDMAVRTLYRLRGADSRLQVAEGLLRPPYEAIGLKSEFEHAIGAVRNSKSIRNQFAHANWLDKDGKLTFIDLEHSAKTNIGDVTHKTLYLDLPLLRQHEAYLNYAAEWFYFLWVDYDFRAGKKPNHNFPAPKIIEPPPLHRIQEAQAPLPPKTGDVPPLEEQAQENLP